MIWVERSQELRKLENYSKDLLKEVDMMSREFFMEDMIVENKLELISMVDDISNDYKRVKEFLRRYVDFEGQYNCYDFLFIVGALKRLDLIENIDRDELGIVRNILAYLEYDFARKGDLELLEIIKKNFSLDANVLQVGCGKIPVLAELVRREQVRLGRGKIEAWDPHVIIDNKIYPELDKIGKAYWKKDFSGHNFLKTDLCLAVDVCPSNEYFLQLASEHDVNLFMLLCNYSQNLYEMRSAISPDGVVSNKVFCEFIRNKYSEDNLEFIKTSSGRTAILRKSKSRKVM